MHYTIPRKSSGTGSIHDLASEHYDRDIEGPGDYAVIYPDYYRGGYMTYATAREAAQKALDLDQEGYGVAIYDNKRGILYCSIEEWLFDPDAPADIRAVLR